MVEQMGTASYDEALTDFGLKGEGLGMPAKKTFTIAGDTELDLRKD